MSGVKHGRVLLALLVCVALNGPPAASAIAPGRAALNLDVGVFNESFEGVFPGTAWTANDTNVLSGNDYWGLSNYRAATGNGSIWAAGNGSQLAVWDAGEVPPINVTNGTNTTIFFDDFEAGDFDANWTAWDEDATDGNDTWGPSTTRSYAGTTSIWSAQVGYNDELLDDNFNVTSYDNYQLSFFARNVSLGNFSNSTIVLEYWWWLDSEQCCDYLYAVYDDGTSWYYETFDSGQSLGWVNTAIEIPSDAIRVGFFFATDASVLAEGAYIDNVSLIVTPPPPPAQPAGPFFDDLEPANASRNWSAVDDDVTYGRDTWGISTVRAHSGTTSLWCAQVGRNSEYGGLPNADIPAYDDSMLSVVSRPIVQANLSLFPSATFSFWYWLDSEQGFDYFSPMYYNQSGWTYLNTWDGSSNGWAFATFTVPNDTEAIGFEFLTDDSVVFEGVYVDDVQVRATRNDPNALLRTYDTSSNTTTSRAVVLTPYAEAYLEFSYWLATDSPNDTLETLAMVGANWTSLDRRSGNSTAWQTLTFPVPTNATRVGFRFTADGVGHSEGAYLDDIRVWGVVYPVNCTANVSALTGVEGVTQFGYSVVASSGLLPYRFAWDFSDGRASVVSSPSQIYDTAGTYAANLTVTDALGQTCRAQAPTITVAHDTRELTLAAPTGDPVEGGNVTVNGTDFRGHALDFDWTLSPAACGSLDRVRGPSVVFLVSQDAGGLSCTVEASIGGTTANRSFAVPHDTTVIVLTPPTSDLVEGQGLTISGVDRFGHPAQLAWSASCGRVVPLGGPSTTFTADDLGGQICTVTASVGATARTVMVTVLHDTSALTVAPSLATPFEGGNQTFSVVDAFGHPASADWSVLPASCGVFSASPASVTTFTSSQEAGGLTCTVAASVGATTRTVEVTVGHDFVGSTISPRTVTVAEGATQDFAVRDRFGHPFDANWDVTPSQCGVLSASTGEAVTLTVGAAVGVTTCTVRAIAPRVSLQATVNTTHGAPAVVQVRANITTVLEGGAVFLETTVLDAAGHALNGFPSTWFATCGAMAIESGRSNTLSVAVDAGGTECNVTASLDDLSGSVVFTVRHASPFQLSISSNGAPGEPQTFTAEVRDRHEHLIPDANITWKASCGSLSAASGPSTTFTPPGDLGGSSCRVTATSFVGSAADEESRVFTTGMSPVIPIGALLAIAGAVGALVVMRRRRGGTGAKDGAEVAPTGPSALAPAAPAAAAAAAAPAVSYALETATAPCPSCGSGVEVGWAACPACGLDLVWG